MLHNKADWYNTSIGFIFKVPYCKRETNSVNKIKKNSTQQNKIGVP